MKPGSAWSSVPAGEEKQFSEAEWLAEGGTQNSSRLSNPGGMFVGFLEPLESSESEAEVRTDLEEKKAKQAEILRNGPIPKWLLFQIQLN